MEQVVLDRIVKNVEAVLEKEFGDENIPSVEYVQNVVEKMMMQEGMFDVAKEYIIYRYEHQKVREEKKQEVLKKIESDGLMITKIVIIQKIGL